MINQRSRRTQVVLILIYSWFLCVYFDQKNLTKNLQPKLKGAVIWPFNACNKVATG